MENVRGRFRAARYRADDGKFKRPVALLADATIADTDDGTFYGVMEFTHADPELKERLESLRGFL